MKLRYRPILHIYNKYCLKITKYVILLFILLLLYMKQNEVKYTNYNDTNKQFTTIKTPAKILINSNFVIRKDAISQMTLIQQRIYLLKLFGYYSTTDDEQKEMIEKQIINYLSKERQIFLKNNNANLEIMSEKIQSRLHSIQNPQNCMNARILLCRIEPYKCGFGCIMHHISYCLSISSGTGRTLIIEDEGTKIWGSIKRYNVKWNELFRTITNCSYDDHVKPFLSMVQGYYGPEQRDRIIFMTHRVAMLYFKICIQGTAISCQFPFVITFFKLIENRLFFYSINNTLLI
uniref:GT23 domain-containing protein n=1 Tax=Meloidogyne incognita TaxID=6306 RepID=A0A914KN72_MELIC